MLDRYAAKARQAIFFARFEASKYGSPYIETEHLLLGLIQEAPLLCELFPGSTGLAVEIRTDIEKKIAASVHNSPALEVPLSEQSKQVLNLATQESNRLRQRRIELKHILVGILRVEGSLAAKFLRERGLKLARVREQFAMAPSPQHQRESS